MIKEGQNRSSSLKVEWKNRCIWRWSPWKGGNEKGHDEYRGGEGFPELCWYEWAEVNERWWTMGKHMRVRQEKLHVQRPWSRRETGWRDLQMLRNIQACREFLCLLKPNWQLPVSKTSTDWENDPENGSFVAYFIHYNKRRRQKEGNRKSRGGRIRGWEKAKRGNLWNWTKKAEWRGTYLFYRGGYRTVNRTFTACGEDTQGTRQEWGAQWSPALVGDMPWGVWKRRLCWCPKGALS